MVVPRPSAKDERDDIDRSPQVRGVGRFPSPKSLCRLEASTSWPATTRGRWPPSGILWSASVCSNCVMAERVALGPTPNNEDTPGTLTGILLPSPRWACNWGAFLRHPPPRRCELSHPHLPRGLGPNICINAPFFVINACFLRPIAEDQVLGDPFAASLGRHLAHCQLGQALHHGRSSSTAMPSAEHNKPSCASPAKGCHRPYRRGQWFEVQFCPATSKEWIVISLRRSLWPRIVKGCGMGFGGVGGCCSRANTETLASAVCLLRRELPINCVHVHPLKRLAKVALRGPIQVTSSVHALLGNISSEAPQSSTYVLD